MGSAEAPEHGFSRFRSWLFDLWLRTKKKVCSQSTIFGLSSSNQPVAVTERCSRQRGLSYHTASCIFYVAELILGPQDWGDQLLLCVLRAKSKEGFAGPQAVVW